MFWRLTYKHIRKLLVIIMSIIFTIIRTTAFCDWVQVGESLNVNIDKQVRCPRIDVSNGTPYVTWWECRSAGIEENYLYVKYYNGSSWIQAGGILNINANNIEFANSTSIAITEGTPYVAWNEKVGTGKMQIYVKHYDGNSWIQDGGSLNIDENQCAVFPDIAINDNGTPYVTWQEELDSVFNIYL
ncbi:hypothetical protein KAR10_02215, partial [bacterium]|nr:hypothetical protein [bacterium]